MLRQYDYSPLTGPIDKAAAKAYAKSVRSDPRFALWNARRWGCLTVLIAVLTPLVVFAFIGVILLGISGQVTPPATFGGVILQFYGLLLLGGVAALAVYTLVKMLARGNLATVLYRVTLFAERNSLRYAPSDPDPEYPGTPFTKGAITILDRFTPLDLGAYDYGVVDAVVAKSSQQWSYLAIPLERTTPHIQLNSRRTVGVLPPLDDSQRLSLEGNFDKHFTLYCPAEYERDALYVFTPDLMALLIDEASPFDVELIDGWIFFYARPLNIAKPATHERFLRIAQIIGEKARSQTENYSDERMDYPELDDVAVGGRRLKRGGPLWILPLALFIVGTPIFALIYDLTAR